MEFFKNAKAVRLRSHHNKYLTAEDDEESVSQNRDGTARQSRWTVVSCGGRRRRRRPHDPLQELLRPLPHRLKRAFPPRHDRLQGQANPPLHRHDSSVEWEPVRDGFQVRLKTPYGRFLRANGGLPPWRKLRHARHPHRTATQDWIIWEVDVVEILPSYSPAAVTAPPPLSLLSQSSSSVSDAASEPSSPPRDFSLSFSRQEPLAGSPPKPVGRTVYYCIADDAGNVDEAIKAPPLQFKGMSVKDLTSKLEEETGLSDIIVCTRNPLNAKQLHPLLLQLRPTTSPCTSSWYRPPPKTFVWEKEQMEAFPKVKEKI
ncbi:unnamed protein product [Spirodela intermedia]|uniref:Uncharacterized protein n=1 Tax=Spirodela intermedia TaxID=51605 RepID=A0A7I8IYQ9_SPIIN|nr:unnamed protein product [Spirodela intermedia]CAA6662852.1 unnamed protein product [Spirodela intermedia]